MIVYLCIVEAFVVVVIYQFMASISFAYECEARDWTFVCDVYDEPLRFVTWNRRRHKIERLYPA